MYKFDIEIDSIDTIIHARFNKVVDFIMDVKNIAKFAFGREEEQKFEFISDTKLRVYDPLVKTTTLCENKILKKENLAIVEHCVKFEEHNVIWEIFLLIKEIGKQTHVLFGWYLTPEIKSYMCNAYSWPEFGTGSVVWGSPNLYLK